MPDTTTTEQKAKKPELYDIQNLASEAAQLLEKERLAADALTLAEEDWRVANKAYQDAVAELEKQTRVFAGYDGDRKRRTTVSSAPPQEKSK